MKAKWVNLYVVERGNDERKVLSQLNQECEVEEIDEAEEFEVKEIDEAEEFEVENSVEKWVGPMKAEMIARQFDNLASQAPYHNVSYNIDIVPLYVDLEIELKTILDDTLCSVCEQHLQEKVLTNERVKELEIFVDNRCNGYDIHNTLGVSHPCGNRIMKERLLCDDI